MLVKRETDKSASSERDRAGIKWWQGSHPANMVSVESPRDYHKLMTQGSTCPSLMIVAFFSESCYTCRALHPKIKKIASLHPEALVLEVNGTPPAMQPLFEELGITKVPFFQLYKAGELVSQFTASLNPEKLAKLRLEVAAHA